MGGPTASTPTISVEGEAGTWTYAPRADNLGTTWTILDGSAELLIASLEFDSDPFVLNNVAITNVTGTTQIYTIGISLPTLFPAPNLISGNVLTGVSDGAALDGATLATVGGFSIYTAQIDFASVATLQDDPFSLVALGGDSASAGASFGPTLSLTPVTSHIGIQLRFSLTAGDTASISSRFDVVAASVPEPATLALLGLGLLGLGFARRRKR